MLHDQKIGILGGGQLGAMLIRHAIDFGLQIATLENDPEAPCKRYTPSFMLGSTLDYDAVMAFGKDLDIITIEKEAVNTDALKALRAQGKKVFPSPEIISTIQDKYAQKDFLQQHNIPVAKGILIKDKEELKQHVGSFPACLKLCRDGYDGKGVMMMRKPEDVEKAFDAPCVLEELVAIRQEISVIVARNEQGEVVCYDPVLMIFNKERFLLDFQLAPAGISEALATEAEVLAKKVAESLELVGILAVEMFVTEEGKLLVNELAPRPHNSGHHTIEACHTSQYEQLIRAITGMKLGDTGIILPSVMVNVLEPSAARTASQQEAIDKTLATTGAHLHWYGKKGGKEGRKMGHVTVTGATIEEALEKSKIIHHILNDTNERD